MSKKEVQLIEGEIITGFEENKLFEIQTQFVGIQSSNFLSDDIKDLKDHSQFDDSESQKSSQTTADNDQSSKQKKTSVGAKADLSNPEQLNDIIEKFSGVKSHLDNNQL